MIISVDRVAGVIILLDDITKEAKVSILDLSLLKSEDAESGIEEEVEDKKGFETKGFWSDLE
jgi:hypothetical protein